MICFPEKNRPKGIVLICLALILAAGCGKSPEPVQSQRDAFDENRFLTAEGSGPSDMDARQQALAQLSSIFEARVSSEFSSRTRSRLTQEQAEEFESEMASKVHVASGVHLKGARIGRAWQDDTGLYHALAVLDRMDAAENWAAELEVLDARIGGAQASRSGASGPLSQLAALNRIITLAGERQILESRLNVVDYPVMTLSELAVDLGDIIAERAGLLSGLRIFVSIAGEYGEYAGDALSQALTGKGLALSPDPDQANVRVLGEVAVTDLNIGHPSAEFARARGNVLVFETRPQTLFVQINDKVRKGNRDIREARTMAAEDLGRSLALELTRALGY
jgi:hypothetical protein